jgi:YD repeat-containing protein
MLAHVRRPDGSVVSFAYDALGRRISKRYRGQTTRWVWDGNVPLHEWVEGDVLTLLRRGQSDRTLVEELDHFAGFGFCGVLELASAIRV